MCSSSPFVLTWLVAGGWWLVAGGWLLVADGGGGGIPAGCASPSGTRQVPNALSFRGGATPAGHGAATQPSLPQVI